MRNLLIALALCLSTVAGLYFVPSRGASTIQWTLIAVSIYISGYIVWRFIVATGVFSSKNRD